jgi:hypothetical protein
MKRAAAIRSWLLVGVLLGAGQILRAETEVQSKLLNYRGGIRHSPEKHRLTDKQLQQLIKSLAAKTGLQEIGFDAEGFMTLGNRKNYLGGSATARQLLMDAVDHDSQLVLENHNRSSSVVFANLGKSTMYISMQTKQQMEHQPLQIDFSDFNKLIGPKEVLASFDLGMTFLHELVHGVRKLKDSVNEWEEIGDCERAVNTMRKELGLPERQQYIARSHTVRSAMGWTIKMAELQFARTDFRNGKLKTDEYKLSWDVNRVGLGDQERVNKTLQATAARKPEQKSSTAVH